MTVVEDRTRDILNNPLVIINIGLENFAQALEDQRVKVTRVDWKPPAGGDKEMLDLLDELL